MRFVSAWHRARGKKGHSCHWGDVSECDSTSLHCFVPKAVEFLRGNSTEARSHKTQTQKKHRHTVYRTCFFGKFLHRNDRSALNLLEDHLTLVRNAANYIIEAGLIFSANKDISEAVVCHIYFITKIKYKEYTADFLLTPGVRIFHTLQWFSDFSSRFRFHRSLCFLFFFGLI